MCQNVFPVKLQHSFQIDNRRTQSLQQLQNALENARGLMTVDYRSSFTGQLRRLQVNLQ